MQNSNTQIQFWECGAKKIFVAILSLLPLSLLAGNPVLRGQWPGGNRGAVEAVAVSNGLAYCALGSGAAA
jgi:hypothetical protein